MSDLTNSGGLPQSSEGEVMRTLLSPDDNRGQDEPEVAASIGEQMLHMDLQILPRSVRARIRDVCARLSPRNAVIIGGGIGHLSAWLFDCWCTDSGVKVNRPGSFRVVEPGKRFGVIIDRLIRRYEAESWAQVISMNWQEVLAETSSFKASNVSLPEIALSSLLPLPIDLFVIDLQEEERISAASECFELLAPGGLMLVMEPTVPTGDVGEVLEGDEPTPAQSKVQHFNQWIELIKTANESHSVGFADLSGGTLVAILKQE